MIAVFSAMIEHNRSENEEKDRIIKEKAEMIKQKDLEISKLTYEFTNQLKDNGPYTQSVSNPNKIKQKAHSQKSVFSLRKKQSSDAHSLNKTSSDIIPE